MSFSKFPNFQSFSLKDKDIYLKYYSQLEAPYCDFSLDDLCIWLNYNHDLEICELNDNLVLRFSNVIDENKPYYTLLGISEPEDTLTTLMKYLKDNSHETRIHYAPEQIIRAIRNMGKFKIEEDINNNDYVYNVADSLTLHGKPYQNLRTRINRFMKENESIQIKEISLEDEHERHSLQATIDTWKHQPEAPNNDPEDWETRTLETHLQLASELPLHAYGIYADEKLVSVIFFNLPPHKDWLICNHVKYDHTYRDIYGYAFYALCKIAASKGIEWINFEQDTGIEGLRRIKSLFRPAKFLKRYTISLDQETNAQ